MEAKVVGVMQMVDSGDADDKIIAVAANDPGVNHYNNIEELPRHFFEELRHFFEEYKKLENKTVVVEEFGDKSMALKVVQDAINTYKENFCPSCLPNKQALIIEMGPAVSYLGPISIIFKAKDTLLVPSKHELTNASPRSKRLPIADSRLKKSLNHPQPMRTLASIRIHNTRIVYLIYPNFTRSMNDLRFIQQYAYMNDPSFGIVKKCQVAPMYFL